MREICGLTECATLDLDIARPSRFGSEAASPRSVGFSRCQARIFTTVVLHNGTDRCLCPLPSAGASVEDDVDHAHADHLRNPRASVMEHSQSLTESGIVYVGLALRRSRHPSARCVEGPHAHSGARASCTASPGGRWSNQRILEVPTLLANKKATSSGRFLIGGESGIRTRDTV